MMMTTTHKVSSTNDVYVHIASFYFRGVVYFYLFLYIYVQRGIFGIKFLSNLFEYSLCVIFFFCPISSPWLVQSTPQLSLRINLNFYTVNGMRRKHRSQKIKVEMYFPSQRKLAPCHLHIIIIHTHSRYLSNPSIPPVAP